MSDKKLELYSKDDIRPIPNYVPPTGRWFEFSEVDDIIQQAHKEGYDEGINEAERAYLAGKEDGEREGYENGKNER